ncbi:MAG TPA: peptide chain release factor 2 [Anaerolineae bacterium]|nr:peptide chain release factor 2 [Anaerolineae bacterium]HID84593.1 peptide chain release factor 2 [Anaerolineales bacterium]HIQ08397.1 peptide chain release factor 2 [Anaerolineaceae bacterium]
MARGRPPGKAPPPAESIPPGLVFIPHHGGSPCKNSSSGCAPCTSKSLTSGGVFDLATKKAELARLEHEAEDPDLWNTPQRAQGVMKRLNQLKEEIEGWEALLQRAQEALELAELEDESLAEDLKAEAEAIAQEVERRELAAMLSGPYDNHNALLAIHAGAGGTDAHDWAEMLQRMYLRWAEKHGYQTEILDFTPGEEAGIKSVTIAVNGPQAYGYLKSEKGVHRLVRLSPFDAAHRRHTSFALVEVLPQVEGDLEVEINPKDLRIDTFRASSAGGQNVQKNATAVRVTHLPTGLVVQCQNERSLTQNKENALKVLKARLLELKQREQAEKIAELRGEYQKAEWGSQIRSYVLHPYQMVKDHRTGHEVGNAQAVLDGDLDGFIEAYLRQQIGQEATTKG